MPILKRTGTTVTCLVFLLVLMIAFPDAGTAGEVEKEYVLKAAFVYKFIGFVEWPDAAPAGKTGPFRLCFAGDAAVAEHFNTLNDKTINNRPIRVHGLASVDECTGCDILFVSRGTDQETMERYLEQLKGKPVLTIGETKGFAQGGGVINIFFKETRPKFEINPVAADRQGLKLSSRLLKLAIIVDEEK